MPNLSIIMPVYNNGVFLDLAIKSVLDQTYADYELILVDDGSLNDCAQNCDRWAEKDTRIITIHQANAGQSIARNAGLAVAKGCYIGFLDADDLFDCNMFACMMYLAETEHLDFIRCRFGRFRNAPHTDLKTEKLPCCALKAPAEVQKTLLLPLLGAEGRHPPFCGTVCTTFFRARLLFENHLFFEDVRTYQSEDLLFNLSFLIKAKTGRLIDSVFYFYRMHPASFTHHYDKQTFQRLLCLDEKLRQFTVQLGETEALFQRCNNRLLDGISVCAKEAALLPETKLAKQQLALMLQSPRVLQALQSPAAKQAVFSIRIFCFMLKGEHFILFRLFVRVYQLWIRFFDQGDTQL